MKRDQVASQKNGSKQIPRLFRCPDCDLRDDLNVMGLPLPHRRYLKFGVRTCETCGGTARSAVDVW